MTRPQSDTESHRGGIKTLCYSVVKQSGETEAWKIKSSVSSVYSVVKSVV